MRQHYLALLSVFASLPAMALTFQTRLENIEWKVEGDKFECRLTQPITDFGSGEFVRRAGEQATFRLKAYNGSLGAGSATLLAGKLGLATRICGSEATIATGSKSFCVSKGSLA